MGSLTRGKKRLCFIMRANAFVWASNTLILVMSAVAGRLTPLYIMSYKEKHSGASWAVVEDLQTSNIDPGWAVKVHPIYYLTDAFQHFGQVMCSVKTNNNKPRMAKRGVSKARSWSSVDTAMQAEVAWGYALFKTRRRSRPHRHIHWKISNKKLVSCPFSQSSL